MKNHRNTDMSLAFRLRPVTEADLPRMVEIVNAQSYYPQTLENARRIEANRRPEDPLFRLVAEAPSGEMAGYGLAYSGLGMRAGEVEIKVRVDGPYQGQGAGRALYAELERWALERRPGALTAFLREVDTGALAWAERRGYERIYHLFRSQLDLRHWRPESFAAAVERVEAQGVRFSSLGAEFTGEETYRRFYEFQWPIVASMPDGDERQRPPYERWRSRLDQEPHWDPRDIILAIDGDRWVGFAAISHFQDGTLGNGFTGVEQGYRGRGIALALKVKALTRAREIGAESISTANHSVNQPMLAVNRKLGYVPLPGSYTLLKRIR